MKMKAKTNEESAVRNNVGVTLPTLAHCAPFGPDFLAFLQFSTVPREIEIKFPRVARPISTTTSNNRYSPHFLGRTHFQKLKGAFKWREKLF
jgi:hypothetical protein